MSLRLAPDTHRPIVKPPLWSRLLPLGASGGAIVIQLFLSAAFFQNIWTSLRGGQTFWFIAGMMAFPIGMLRGIAIWLGWAG